MDTLSLVLPSPPPSNGGGASASISDSDARGDLAAPKSQRLRSHRRSSRDGNATAPPVVTRRHRYQARRYQPHARPVAFLTLLVLMFWGWPVLTEFSSLRLANGGDSVSFEFYLGWNVHAVLNGENPFFTPHMYAPAGLDLGNAISVPAVSLLLAPVTLLVGATAAYNVGVLLAVLLAAVATYLLAHELTDRRAGSVAAGALMAVNPYFTGHALSHFNLLWIFGLPMISYLFVRHLRRRLRARWFVIGTAVIVAFTFGASTELVVTQVIFGGVALVVALVVARAHRRPLLRSVTWLTAGGILGAVAAIPVIAASLSAGIPSSPANPPALYSTDLFNVVAPTRLFLLGGQQAAPWTADWLGNDAENTAYIPVVLILLAAVVILRRRTRLVWALALLAVTALVFSFGPSLVVDGTPVAWMPWRLTGGIPGLDHALPGRFSTYTFLALLLLIAAGWPRNSRAAGMTVGAVAVSVLLLIPDFRVASIPVPVADQTFVDSGAYRDVMDRDEVVLVMPGGQAGPGLSWMVESNFYFRVPTGNGGGATAPADLSTPIGLALYQQDTTFDYDRLKRWARERDVSVVLVPEQERFYTQIATRSFGPSDRTIAGVRVWALS